jgi:hypothetical protein
MNCTGQSRPVEGGRRDLNELQAGGSRPNRQRWQDFTWRRLELRLRDFACRRLLAWRYSMGLIDLQ